MRLPFTREYVALPPSDGRQVFLSVPSPIEGRETRLSFKRQLPWILDVATRAECDGTPRIHRLQLLEHLVRSGAEILGLLVFLHAWETDTTLTAPTLLALGAIGVIGGCSAGVARGYRIALARAIVGEVIERAFQEAAPIDPDLSARASDDDEDDDRYPCTSDGCPSLMDEDEAYACARCGRTLCELHALECYGCYQAEGPDFVFCSTCWSPHFDEPGHVDDPDDWEDGNEHTAR